MTPPMAELISNSTARPPLEQAHVHGGSMAVLHAVSLIKGAHRALGESHGAVQVHLRVRSAERFQRSVHFALAGAGRHREPVGIYLLPALPGSDFHMFQVPRLRGRSHGSLGRIQRHTLPAARDPRLRIHPPHLGDGMLEGTAEPTKLVRTAELCSQLPPGNVLTLMQIAVPTRKPPIHIQTHRRIQIGDNRQVNRHWGIT